ncbi:uncharacterized protein LOC143042222 [Mytilus galloprovincialis]|uniref:uncharacterized protein LOC143042222 n=1 Tax=Mytilus galloprovincialis TaxID=29158 RepID=UPI003F7C58B7
MQFYSVCLILFLYKTSEAIYSFRCPVQAHWKHRSEATCDSWDKYFCVYDQNKNNFSEFCRDNPDFEAPGLKLTISGSIQGVVCDNDFYQPNKFWSSGNSRCAFKKSICSDEGQLLFNNGTTEDDRLCRCDYTKGYDFIVRPQHECYCIPSEEDCSCYNKKCSVNDILSPDYECIDRKTWEPNSNCDSIDIIGLR